MVIISFALFSVYLKYFIIKNPNPKNKTVLDILYSPAAPEILADSKHIHYSHCCNL